MAKAKAKKINKKMTSKEIQLMVAKKVTDKILFAELHRFSTMERPALKARLKRIKNPVKAEACRIMAKIAGFRMLAVNARDRRDELAIQ